MNFLLSTVYHNFKTNDEHMGYLKGVQEVITKLEILSKAGDED